MTIKLQSLMTGMFAVALALAAVPDVSASTPRVPEAPAQMVITAQPVPQSGIAPQTLAPGDLTILQSDTRVPVLSVQRLSDALADMQLFVLLDDSTPPTTLGIQLPELKRFIESLPATTLVAVGYMRNGGVDIAQPFTTDHQKDADSLRLPEGVPGINASPYFALSHLASHWPSKEATTRRVALVFTDGVDRYYQDPSVIDDPYVDAAIAAALKNNVVVYSVYLRGAGNYGLGGWVTSMAQSRLIKVSKQTGGYAYQEDFTNPVSIAPFLSDLRDRLDHQYKVTFAALNQRGVQPVKLRTEAPGLKVDSPTRIYVP